MNTIGLRVMASIWLFGVILSGVAGGADEQREAGFGNLPPGCSLNRSIELPADKVAAVGKKLGAAVRRISNNYLTIQGSAIQVNILEGRDEADTAALFKAVSAMKRHPAFCLRDGGRVVEFVGSDAALAIKTSYELGFVAKPKKVRYRVTADVATVDKADYMAGNELFNLFLSADTRTAIDEVPPKIAELTKRFRFSNKLSLREPGEPARLSYNFTPEPSGASSPTECGKITYSFATPLTSRGVPYVTVTAVVSADETGFTPATRAPNKSLLCGTAWWPVDDPVIIALAERITSGASTHEAKVQAILKWLSPGANVRFSGPVSGSRWGVKNVLQQKHGHCWDFADCFVTICRAAGIPCRQVAGWLYGTSGHVWAEVLVEGKGWQQVDATGGDALKCGIYHIPYFTTEDGEMPVLYVSMPKVDILETN